MRRWDEQDLLRNEDNIAYIYPRQQQFQDLPAAEP